MPQRTTSSLSPRQWSRLREDQAATGNLLLALKDARSWACFTQEGLLKQANAQLEKRYAWKGTEGSFDWSAALIDEGWHGFVLPAPEVDQIDGKALTRSVASLGFMKERFNWRGYLMAVVQADQMRTAKQPRVLSALWHFVLHYADWLNVVHREGKGVSEYVRELPGGTPFEERLRVEQAVILLLKLCLEPYPNAWEARAFDTLLGKAHPEVTAFVNTHRGTFNRAFRLGRSKLAKPAEKDFYRLFALDFPLAVIQEVLDDAMEAGLSLKLLHKLVEGGEVESAKPDFAARIKSFAANVRSDMARLSDGAAAPARSPRTQSGYAPLYGWLFKDFTQDHKRSWALRSAEEREKILEAYGEAGNPDQAAICKRLVAYYARVASGLSAPIVAWAEEEATYPRWVSSDKVTEVLAQRAYREEQERAQREMAQLDRQIPVLRAASSQKELKRLADNLQHFQSPIVIRKLRSLLKQNRLRIDNRDSYRRQRLREFGIDQADESAYRKALWLEEMLKIEEEVRPYLNYVRRAFANALPGGTTVEFNPYRHSHDGVEFDPDTVQNQDKWLRGEVMKTLRGRKHYTPIVQVNTFCLDYSRSMIQTLMRDLYKVVFALISGLEGKTSYDAVHFFSSDFFEVVGFENSEQFTSRRILFRILRQVAEIQGGRVVYGGNGGTNISAGIEESYIRTQAFTDKLKRRHPDMRFVSSLFVLTDGQPTLGITDLQQLNEYIEDRRRESNIEIKGIYLKHPKDTADFISQIFGPEHSVDASEFAGTIRTFVELMGRTYRKQRQDFRAAEKRRRLLGDLAAENYPNA